MDPDTAAALIELGSDSAGFKARDFTRELAEDADLVLTMTRDQRRTVLEASPRGLRRTFTLTEAADLLRRADLAGLSLLPLAARARELGRRLDAARAGRPTGSSDDIADPIGQRAEVHQEVAELVATALRPLADVLFTSVRVQLPAPVAV
jgi:protein-tyrosine phosphatase